MSGTVGGNNPNAGTGPGTVQSGNMGTSGGPDTSGASGNLPPFVFDPNAAGTAPTDPVLQDAYNIYYKLYGVAPPSGYVESLEKTYGNIYSIEAALVAQAKQDKAPGLSNYLGSSSTLGGAQPVNPVLSAAESYYFQLYGKQAPKGMLQDLIGQGMDLYAIQNQLLESGKNAPGYDFIRYQNLLANGNSLYFRLWGEDPPPQAVKGLVDQGLNLFQMEKTWRADPTFHDTRTYRDEQSQYAATLANALGER